MRCQNRVPFATEKKTHQALHDVRVTGHLEDAGDIDKLVRRYSQNTACHQEVFNVLHLSVEAPTARTKTHATAGTGRAGAVVPSFGVEIKKYGHMLLTATQYHVCPRRLDRNAMATQSPFVGSCCAQSTLNRVSAE